MTTLRGGRAVEGGSERLYRCPDCHKEKLHINTRKRLGWCFVCEYKLSPMQVEDLLYDGIPVSSYSSVSLAPNPELWDPLNYVEARKYLKWRGVVPEEHPEIFYQPELRRLYFRIWSPEEDMHPSYHTRGIDKAMGWQVMPGTQKEKYWFGKPPWHIAMPGEKGKPRPGRVVLVEGIFDALRIGNGAMSLLGIHLSDAHLSWLVKYCGQVLVWMDGLKPDGTVDEVGRKAERKIVKRLKENGLKARGIGGEDIPEPGDLDEADDYLGRVQKWLKLEEKK